MLYGAGGRIGWELRRSLAPLGDLIALDIRRPAEFNSDVTKTDQVRGTLRSLRPDVIINAAAYTNVDGAEAAQQRAFNVNGTAPGVIAEEAAALDCWMIHYSTDYIFDGSKIGAYVESDAPSPLNVYGHSKLQGEQAVRAKCRKHFLFRTSWIHCPRRPSFAAAIIERARLQPTLEVVEDQVGAPTGADLVADVTAHAVRAVGRGSWRHLSGVYNLTASGAVSRDEYARFVLRWAHAQGIALSADADAVRAVPGSGQPSAARRPANSLLDTRKLEVTFDLSLPNWQIGIERMLTERFTGS
jgi:dTDP-4-dehydrorhamnose reductase